MNDDELIMISGLTHLAYCERRFALVHIEQAWEENIHTALGHNFHEKVHGEETESRQDLKIVRGLRLRSLALGITGHSDVVEFYKSEGNWTPFPVEYKKGGNRLDIADEVQLCAQALCLEEMLGVDVPRGAIFYGKPRRRTQVEFDIALRNKVKELVAKAKELTEKGTMPPPRVGKHCKNCSMEDICMPNLPQKSAQGYIKKLLKEASNETIT